MTEKPDIECPNSARCPLFPLLNSKAVLGFWKNLYCYGEFATCKRYEYAQRGVVPPDNMLPSGEMLNEKQR